MAIGKQQACWAIPNLSIDCMLTRVHRHLEADGCVLRINESSSEVAAPDQLAPGDFVKVRLWLDDGGASIHIGLAEVRQIQNHWITVEVIHVNRHERARLQRYVESLHPNPADKPVYLDHLLIRA
jgi:hypothetical protein